MLKTVGFPSTRTGDQTIVNGNEVFDTPGKGVNFTANTPAAGMTSQLLNWYEEGTWTPGQGSGLTVVGTFSSSGTYTRIGRQVTVNGVISATTSVACASGSAMCTGLPFAVSGGGSSGTYFNSALSNGGVIDAYSSSIYAIGAIGATGAIYFTVTYFV